MSTVLILVEHEKAGRLRRFQPSLRGDEAEVRHLTLVPYIDDWLTAPAGTVMKAKIKAHFGEFARGELIDDLYFMKRIEDRRRRPPSFSHEVWAMTPRFGAQRRFFGVFAIKDWFVALKPLGRNDLESSPELWHAGIDESLTLWSNLFPGRLPWSGNDLSEYVSNAEKCDDRW
jgi:hypothetical protein